MTGPSQECDIFQIRPALELIMISSHNVRSASTWETMQELQLPASKLDTPSSPELPGIDLACVSCLDTYLQHSTSSMSTHIATSCRSEVKFVKAYMTGNTFELPFKRACSWYSVRMNPQDDTLYAAEYAANPTMRQRHIDLPRAGIICNMTTR